MNNERRGVWKKKAWPCFRYYPSIFLKELNKTKKTSTRTTGLQADFNPGPEQKLRSVFI
jgi:hypothetical protein